MAFSNSFSRLDSPGLDLVSSLGLTVFVAPAWWGSDGDFGSFTSFIIECRNDEVGLALTPLDWIVADVLAILRVES